MKSTCDYLDDLAVMTNTGSDYAIAKLLNISTSRLSNYRRKRNAFDDEAAFKAAQLLGLDPMIVIAEANAERAHKEETRQFWRETYKRLTNTAAGVILSLAIIGGTLAPSLAYASFDGSIICIMRTTIRRLLRALLACGVLFAGLSPAVAQPIGRYSKNPFNLGRLGR